MDALHDALNLVKGAARRNDRNKFSGTNEFLHLKNGEEHIRNGQWLRGLVDANMKCRYGDNYTPIAEDEDVGNTILNSTFIGNEALEELAKMLQEGADGSSASSEDGKASKLKPDQSSYSDTPLAPKKSGFSIPGWLKTAALIGATGLATGVVMNYLADDTDTRNTYTIKARAFDPTKPPS